MPKCRKSRSKAKEAADVARPYVEKLIDDEDLRASLKEAYEAARGAYDRAADGKAPAKAVLEDKRLHEELKTAAESLREATEAFREPEPEPSRHRLMKLFMLAVVGAILALALSEDLRKQLLDRLFGAEEEFEYTSTTAPAAPPAAPPAATG